MSVHVFTHAFRAAQDLGELTPDVADRLAEENLRPAGVRAVRQATDLWRVAIGSGRARPVSRRKTEDTFVPHWTDDR